MIPNHLSIPQARALLHDLANQHGIQDLHDIANALYRRNIKGKRAPVTSTKVTPALVADIRSHVRQHPNDSNQKIANLFNVNPGRITDALMD